MKSGKQRAAELKAKRRARAAKTAAAEASSRTAEEAARRIRKGQEVINVNPDALAPIRSVCDPEYAARGVYLDVPFTCVGCGTEEVWAATQQKWWYEVAKGDPFTTARRCRNCRRKERERKASARKVHLEGLARKKPT